LLLFIRTHEALVHALLRHHCVIVAEFISTQPSYPTKGVDMSAILENILNSLGGHQTRENEIMVHCCAHEDPNPSLSITEQGGRLLVKCFAGCDQENVISGLRDRGLWPSGAGSRGNGIPKAWHGKRQTGLWEYRGGGGELLGYVARFDDQSGKDVVPFFKRNVTGWSAGAAPEPRPLYGLHKLQRHQGPVLILEGEKATDAAQRLAPGYACLTWPGGCKAVGKADFTPLAGRDVIIWPDADEPGYKAAKDVFAVLKRSGAASVRVIDVPSDKSKGWDAADAIAEGWTSHEFNALVVSPSQSPRGETVRHPLKVLNFHEFLALELPVRGNVLFPVLPQQGLVMLYAPRGVGKTWASLSMAWAAASGGKALGGWSADRPWRVIYIDGEMPAAVLQERLAFVAQGAGGDCDPDFLKILTPDIQEAGMPNLATPEGRAALEPYIADREVIVIDNLATLSRGGRENEAESWLPMQEWCLDMRRRGKSVVLIHHAGKSGQQRGTSAREDILDTVISLRKAKDYEPNQGAKFEVHLEKCRPLEAASDGHACPYRTNAKPRSRRFWLKDWLLPTSWRRPVYPAPRSTESRSVWG
jgi:hypothetical protein